MRRRKERKMRNKLTFIALLIISLLFIGVGVTLAQEGDPDRGAQIYAQNCAVCHGPEAKGRIGINLSQDFPSINVDAFLKQNIANGVSGTRMPAWGQANGGPLSEQEIADVAAYVAGLTGGSEPVAPAPTFIPPAITPAAGVTGNAVAGARVFAENCVMCHGDHGQGRIGAVLQKDWPSINPSAYIRQTVENGVEKTLMPAWLDANGFPKGPTFFMDWNLRGTDVEKFKGDTIEALAKRLPNVKVGFGDLPTDARAYLRCKLTPYILRSKPPGEYPEGITPANTWEEILDLLRKSGRL